MQTRLTEQEIMTDLLSTEKHTTMTYDTFISETDCSNLRGTLQGIQQDEQTIHADLFNAIKQRGWYNPPKAEVQAVQNAKTKYTQVKGQL
jgi:spore coat protein F